MIDLIKNSENFNIGHASYCKTQKFRSKRIWCSIRDYLLDPEYKAYFNSEIKTVLEDDISSLPYLKQLELPGDIWNNNSHFIQCNFKREDYIPHFNKYLRKVYDKNANSHVYAAQFDVTFSLAPRMCENLDCAYCPYGLLHAYKNDGTSIVHKMNELCVDDCSKICPVVLHSTGYKMYCKGKKNCVLYITKKEL